MITKTVYVCEHCANHKQYLAKIGAKGGKAKSAAKTAAARKANAARWRNHKPKRVTANGANNSNHEHC